MRQPVEPVELVLADGGAVTSADVQRLLRLHGIIVRRVRFGAAHPAHNCTVPWTGVGVRDETVHGTLALVIDAGGRYVLVEGRLETDAVATLPAHRAIPGDPRALLPREAQAVELLARDAIRQAVEQPGCASSLVAYLAAIIDLVEGGQADQER